MEDNKRRDLLSICFYVSKYDMQAVKNLGCKSWKQLYSLLAKLFESNTNTIKARRDDFDHFISTKRKGWNEVKTENEIKMIIDKFSFLDYDDVSNLCKDILNKYSQPLDFDLESDALYIEKINDINLESVAYKKFLNSPNNVVKYSKRNINIVIRDMKVACNALINADYKCELDVKHVTFLRKKNGLPYTEPHHLIPLEYQKKYKNSLDVENNIVSLCSNCHNKLHYGKGIERDLYGLFNKRKDLLKKAGITITFEELLNMYR